MKKYDIIIVWNDNKRQAQKGCYIKYLFLKLRFLFSKVEVSKI